jgi:tetratricopeptide (TPR) repeat protein/tRNA A-37 threonylcarbamoyl transferase component Bud32
MSDGERRPRSDDLETTDQPSHPAPHDPEVHVKPVSPEQLAPPGRPERIGGFRIKRAIGSGGMGTVYLAQQEHPRRVVALKVMRAGIASASATRRFEYESQILARLRHPNIAQVYEAGRHVGESGELLFFAMEYISNAKAVIDYAHEKKLGLRDRLRLFVKVCDAVHHGHQKGVIHRDLKPANILVDSTGEPKIIDFGVARSTDSDMAVTTLQTDIGQLIGTLQYMSPEQCDADPHDLDTRSDIYALGVVLYELLCGRLPYDVTHIAVYEAARVIKEQSPARPSTINRTLRGDLETITLKALEKERDRRYQSAADFREDIEHYLNYEAITAAPPSVAYRVRKFVQRNRGPVIAGATIFALLVLGFLGTSWGMMRALETNEELGQANIDLRSANQDLDLALTEVKIERDRAKFAESRAEAEAERAREAERESARRAEALSEIAGFQASMLTGIDVDRMGRQLRESVRDEARRALERIDPAEVDARVDELNEILAGVNMTNVAVESLDETILARSQAAIRERFRDQPLVRASLLQTVANVFRELGLAERSESAQREALELRRQYLSDDHPDTLDSHHQMAVLLIRQGERSLAKEHLSIALEGRRRLLGDDHRDTLHSINDMGVLLEEDGRIEEATKLYREALAGRRRVLGDDDPDTLESLSNLGGVLRRQGKLAEADACCTEVLKRCQRVLGGTDRMTMTALHNMAQLRQAQGDLDEAEDFALAALERRRQVLGDDHPATLASLSTVSSVLAAQGDFERAAVHLQQALAGCRRTRGDDHPMTLTLINNTGAMLYRQGKLAEAERYFREALEIRERNLPEDHPSLLSSLSNVGSVLRLQGKLAEAEPYLRRVLDASRRSRGPDDPETMKMAHNMAGLLLAQGKDADAEALYREVLAHRRNVLGDDHAHTQLTLLSLADLLAERGDHDEAARLLEDSATTPESLTGVTRLLEATLRAKKGGILLTLERFAEAEPELLAAHGILIETVGPKDARTTGVIEKLVDLYDRWNERKADPRRAEQASRWREKLPAGDADAGQ